VIPKTAEGVWVSRLRTSDFDAEMGFESAAATEIPHVRGRPVDLPMPDGATVIREWPNIAGRLEVPEPSHVVRWCRSLSARPPQGIVIARGDAVDTALIAEMRSWLTRFARALSQIPGVSVAVSGDSPRAVVLTPRGLTNRPDLPGGMEPVPTRLAEFPGGVILTMDRNSFEHRSQYAGAVEMIIEEA
jgi:hypothetical protein